MIKKVLAIHCHPDDIEFMMSGTLFLLKENGFELNYMNVANGCYGSAQYSKDEAIKIRCDEAKLAADYLGANYHHSLVDDLSVFYSQELIRRALAVIRQVSPDILLLPSPEDYMEDHMNTCRIAVTAAFCRGMPNYESIPKVPSVNNEMVLYHAMPYGLVDGLGHKIEPNFYIGIEDVMHKKAEMLKCHQSQKVWLDHSQGMNSYIETMNSMCETMGDDSGKFSYAEGWRRHSHLGFSSEVLTPLEDIFSS